MPEWIPGAIIVALMALAGLVWRAHEKRDDERNDALWDQVGRDSESGMRRTVHASANLCQGHEGEIRDLKEQVARLQNRVFNGHK